MVAPQFFKMLKMVQKGRPAGAEIPEAARIPPKDRLKDSDLPFVPGDRVQIASGPDKGKVGRILLRYPGFGNAFMVAGVGTTNVINPIESKYAEQDQDQYDAVTPMYKTFDYKDLRLVSRIKNEDGSEEDVCIHSIELGPPVYDPVSNSYPRIRYAKHDKSITIPTPLNKPEPIEKPITTNAVAAEARTHFVTSAIDCPIPIGAIDQVTNLNNRYKRGRYARRVTAKDIAKAAAPAMPVAPKTRELLEKLKNLPKPEQPEFTREIEDFLGEEIKRGLQKRISQQDAAAQSYQ